MLLVRGCVIADNVVANPGASGAVFATDDISGVHFPRNKITIGIDGVNDGDVSLVNPLPIFEARQTSFDHLAKSGIGTTAVQLIVASTTVVRGVLVKAADDNGATARIAVGNSDVTYRTADATDGYELGSGHEVFIPVDNANKIWLIGSTMSLRVTALLF